MLAIAESDGYEEDDIIAVSGHLYRDFKPVAEAMKSGLRDCNTRARMMSRSSIPNIIADTLLAIKRSTTANVASISIAIIDPSTVDSRLSLRLGTASKHSLDTSEKDPIVLRSYSNILSRHQFISREACALPNAGLTSYLVKRAYVRQLLLKLRKERCLRTEALDIETTAAIAHCLEDRLFLSRILPQVSFGSADG